MQSQQVEEYGAGDVITIDMGCKYKGYCSDMTRTIFVKEVPDKVKKVYDLVLENQTYVLRAMQDGVNIKNTVIMVDNNFKEKNHVQIHALGHGVGLENHELPYITSNYNNVLKENMVVTCEPGIYIPGEFGVRIEDTVLITKNGYETLTKSPKDYVIIH